MATRGLLGAGVCSGRGRGWDGMGWDGMGWDGMGGSEVGRVGGGWTDGRTDGRCGGGGDDRGRGSEGGLSSSGVVLARSRGAGGWKGRIEMAMGIWGICKWGVVCERRRADRFGSASRSWERTDGTAGGSEDEQRFGCRLGWCVCVRALSQQKRGGADEGPGQLRGPAMCAPRIRSLVSI